MLKVSTEIMYINTNTFQLINKEYLNTLKNCSLGIDIIDFYVNMS